MSATPPNSTPTRDSSSNSTTTPGSHRRNRSRTRIYRALSLGLLATAVGSAAIAGTLLNGSDARPASATADASAQATDRAQADKAGRDFARTAPSTAAPSPSASSAKPSPTGPAPAPSSAAPKPAAPKPAAPKPAAPKPPAQPAVPAGCTGYAGAQLTACTLLPEFGLSTSEMASLAVLWEGESNWNVYANNPDSGAYGIPQALPGEKMATAGPNWQTDAATQIRWGLGYITEVYGTPSNALAQWQARSPHWY